MVLCMACKSGLIIRIALALAPVNCSIVLAVVIKYSLRFSRVPIPALSEAIVVTTSTYSKSFILASLGITAWIVQLPIDTPYLDILDTLGTQIGNSFKGVKSITNLSFKWGA